MVGTVVVDVEGMLVVDPVPGTDVVVDTVVTVTPLGPTGLLVSQATSVAARAITIKLR